MNGYQIIFFIFLLIIYINIYYYFKIKLPRMWSKCDNKKAINDSKNFLKFFDELIKKNK